VVVENGSLAADLLRVFENDLHVSGRRFDATGVEPLDLPPPLTPISEGAPPAVGDVALMVGPEAWGHDLRRLLGLVEGAGDSISLQLAYLDVRWGGAVSPLVRALLGAADRGVLVRVMLDPGSGGVGIEALRELQLLSRAEGAPNLQGVLATELAGASRVHTKGMLVDRCTAVLGSLNWGWSAVARNREVVVAVEGEDAVLPLVEAFEADWKASAGRAPPTAPPVLMMECAARWEGRTYPRRTIERLDGGGDGAAREDPGGTLTLEKVARTALVVGLFITLWALDRRFAYTVRASLWTRRRVRGLRRRAAASSPPPPRGEGAPGAPRTTCPGSDPGKGPPPSAPSPRPPRRRGPRVVRLEEVR
jgi:hypothetical protein